MLLLAADTSGKHGSIALARCNPDDGCTVIEVVPLAGGTFSAQLVPQIAELFQKHGFRKQDLGGLAVATGPGSFTGLRVGLAAIKALAEVLGKPIALVSILEAVATMANLDGKILAVMDAGRGEVYAGEYEVGSKDARAVSERLLQIEELIASAQAAPVVTPDRNIGGHLQAAGLRVVEVDRPCSDAIARLGWRKIQAGNTAAPEDLEANYIRRSDAEIFPKRISR
jgi:tRNA threonylcarbamoyladenosine biosynthesis protein TsaB